jgi:xanthine dehydrogenase YagR molybdenum-binding subunit
VQRAVAAAEAAQVTWRELSVPARPGYLNRLADAVEARAEDLLAIEVADTGNTITGMASDIASCIERLRYNAALGYELQGETIPSASDRLQLTLRDAVAQKLGINSADAVFTDGQVRSGNRSVTLAQAASPDGIVAEDNIEYGDLGKRYQQSTFGAHFVEVGVDVATGETRIHRMLAVCWPYAGRLRGRAHPEPQDGRIQVIGAMTMGVGEALMEELAVDKRHGFFVNHDLAGYEVPVHADIPHQEVVFLDEVDPMSSPMKAEGVGELGLCGVGAAIANAIYNATGVRIRDYPITLDKHLDRLPELI